MTNFSHVWIFDTRTGRKAQALASPGAANCERHGWKHFAPGTWEGLGAGVPGVMPEIRPEILAKLNGGRVQGALGV